MGHQRLSIASLQVWHTIRTVDLELWASQMGPHQVSYVDVEQLIHKRFRSAQDMSFPTIGTDYNGPSAAFNRFIAGVAYD